MADRAVSVIRALQDSFLPCQTSDQFSSASHTSYHNSSGADLLSVPDEVLDTIDQHLYGPNQDQLRWLLWGMSCRLPMLLLAGHRCLSSSWPFVLSFPEMSLPARQETLYSFRDSHLPALKRGYKALKSLVASALLAHIDPTSGSSPLLPALRYLPGSAVSESSAGPPPPAAGEAEEVLASATVHLPDLPAGAAEARAFLEKRGFQTGAGAAGSGVPGGQQVLQLHYDAVVVGSGAGGGVTAALLAAAGMKVLVLEKSGWVRRKDMSWLERASHSSMYERGGFLISDDAAITLLAGSTLGGGTKINWTASLKPPPHVRREWAAAPHNLPMLGPDSAAFDAALEAVCSRMGVHQTTKMSTPNQLLLDGLQTLGLHGEELPRNCLSDTCHAYCNMGCRSGHKQSSDVCWLVDAVRAGAHILTGVQGQQILTAPAKQGGSRSKRVIGLVAEVAAGPHAAAQRLQLLVHTPLVVASCGSIHSPALLLRSGITVNGNVGRHLRIHPASGIVGAFKPTAVQVAAGQGAVRMYEGVSMGAFSLAAANWEGDGYGAMVSVPAVHPGLLAAICPDTTSGNLKTRMLQLQDTSTCVIFTRDSSSGRVRIDAAGRPVISYWPCETTMRHLIDGIEVALKALMAAGATSLLVPNSVESWEVFLDPAAPLDSRVAEVEQLVQRLRRTGIRKYDVPLFSAHQMGSCRMGSSPQSSVCDSSGQCWEVAGLYVADASTFPTASGVNPMITVYGISHMVASGIAATWRAAAKKME